MSNQKGMKKYEVFSKRFKGCLWYGFACLLDYDVYGVRAFNFELKAALNEAKVYVKGR